jgi:hypothetical protein
MTSYQSPVIYIYTQLKYNHLRQLTKYNNTIYLLDLEKILGGVKYFNYTVRLKIQQYFGEDFFKCLSIKAKNFPLQPCF